ncbi:hypothetical protein GQ457_01G015880 [Hibiscus cannabinus]
MKIISLSSTFAAVLFSDCSLIREEQDVVYASPNSIEVVVNNPCLSLVGLVITNKVVDGESVRASILKRGPWVFNNDWFCAPTTTYGPVDVAPLCAIPISDAPSSLIIVTPLSANANAFVANLVENAEDAKVHGATVVGDHDLSDVFAVDDAGCVHVFENDLFCDENDVFATRISHAVAAPVKTAPSFDAIEEWLTEN